MRAADHARHDPMWTKLPVRQSRAPGCLRGQADVRAVDGPARISLRCSLPQVGNGDTAIAGQGGRRPAPEVGEHTAEVLAEIRRGN